MGFKPAQRLSAPDPVLRKVGHVTEDVVLTPTAATLAGGAGYNCGKVTQLGRGVYQLAWQAGDPPLSTPNYIEFEVYEDTAGVYLVALRTAHAAADANVDLTDRPLADVAVDGDFGAATVDGNISVAVATATGVTNLASATQSVTAEVGDLVFFDAIAASARTYKITRLS